ncbi:MAG: YlxR family protein [Ruminococcaceae bacterium]|nr:YlxR family protein [Oscillospiraceae bacterium]
MSETKSANGGKVKKIPMRQCLGCNEHKPKGELLRVVRSPEGEISLDFTGKKSGRGAYICKNIACLKRVRKSRRLEHNLACAISPEVYDRMEAELSEEA